VTTGTEPGVVIRGDSLATWGEATLLLRSSNRANTSASQQNQAVTVGWNNRIEGADTSAHGPPARYAIELPAGLASGWALDGGHTLDFLLGPTNDVPGPRKNPSAGENGGEAVAAEAERAGGADAEEAEDAPVDLSIEIADAEGRTARVTLSDYGAIRRPLETYVMRRGDLEDQRFQRHWELIQQTYSIPLSDFLDDNRSLDLSALRSVAFVFDLVHAGEVAIDEVGFTDIDPAFLSARVDGR
jgi:hypothetical protein